MDVVPKFIAAVLVGLLVLLVGVMPAEGHADLESSNPADGSEIASAPAAVELTFSEDVGSGFVAVTAPDGTTVKTSEPRIDGVTMAADLAKSDQHGRYTVAYRIVSADGHPVAGKITFTTTSGQHVTQQQEAPRPKSFIDRHGTLLITGLVIAMLAIALMLSPLTRRRRQA
jgi:methionine-rich copper-binding protein CopC